jgi:hypothetical protein
MNSTTLLLTGILAAASISFATPFLRPHAVSPSAIEASVASVHIYRSEKLGVQFNYLSSDDGSVYDIPIIEEGNRIYVGGKDGQWVEKFTKDPQDTLEEAVTKSLLSGTSRSDCVAALSLRGQGTVEIKIVKAATAQNIEDPIWTHNPCPPEYRFTYTTGGRYFSMDPQHPDAFYFFSIGQYAIPAEPDVRIEIMDEPAPKSWQDTFKIVSSKQDPIPTHSEVQTYINKELGYSLKYPSDFMLGSREGDCVRSKDVVLYKPCIDYIGTLEDVSGATVYIGASTSTPMADCQAIKQNGGYDQGNKEINGVTFTHSRRVGSNDGYLGMIDAYYTYHNKICYNVQIGRGFSDPFNDFNDASMSAMEKKLNDIVSTFTFTQ